MFAPSRLLPVTVAAALLLALEVGGLWQGAAAVLGSAAAQGAEEAPTERSAPEADQPAVLDRRTPTFDVADVSAAEIELLENLVARREALEARERELDMRENLLAAAEQRVDAKITELKKIEASVSKVINEREESKIRSLVKIYEKMKAKDAARIFNQLDQDTVLAVVERMRESKAAAVIAQMEGKKAKAVTTDLARLRALPKPGGAKPSSEM